MTHPNPSPPPTTLKIICVFLVTAALIAIYSIYLTGEARTTSAQIAMQQFNENQRDVSRDLQTYDTIKQLYEFLIGPIWLIGVWLTFKTEFKSLFKKTTHTP